MHTVNRIERNSLEQSDSQRLRHQILHALHTYQHPGPSHVGAVYVSPTKFCHVGCDHCNFASLPMRAVPGSRDAFHTMPSQTRLLEFVNQLQAWKVVLSGGGEPLLEPAMVERFIEQVTSERLEEIEVVTSGFWGKTPAAAQKVLARLAHAYHRRASTSHAKFFLRLSVDWFHRQSLGLAPIEEILRVLDRPDFADIHCYIRSVLLLDDSTMEDLATAVGAQLGPLADYQQLLTLPSGRQIPVYYKNLILDGRLSQQNLGLFPVKPSPVASANVFSDRFRDTAGRFIPGLTYGGPIVRHLDGVALDIEHDGSVRILEATAPDNVPSLYTHDWPAAREMLYTDPLTIYLLEDGPEALAALMQDFHADTVRVAKSTNQLYFMVNKLLNTPDARLWATVNVLLLHRERGRYFFDDHLLQEAIQYLKPLEGKQAK